MLFNFQLSPVEDIKPWTTPSRGNEKSLHWFGLTLGRYWLQTGAGELFRDSPGLLQHWARTYPGVPNECYVDNQVSRLWEDVLGILPTVLEPVPDDLASYLRPGGAWDSWATWDGWTDRAYEWIAGHQEEAGWDEMLGWDKLDAATRWWSSRRLDAGHLTKPPRLWFWREKEQVRLRWDNRGQLIDGRQVWAGASGQVTLPVAEFVAEVQSFDQRLMRAMAERVDSVRHNWSRPEVRRDWPKLREEHRHRAAQFSKVLAQAPSRTDWDQVRAALTEMEHRLTTA